MNSGPINNEGYFRFRPYSITSLSVSDGYYFAIDTTADFKPSFL